MIPKVSLLKSEPEKAVEYLNSWPIIRSPVHMVLVVSAYFFFIYVAGPRITSGKKPYELRKTMMVYNFFQVAYNVYLLHFCNSLVNGLVISTWTSTLCYPVSAVNNFNPEARTLMLRGMCLYYINKLIDLLDTVFITLRKKDSQITFLHIYHHLTMVVSTWYAVFHEREEISVFFAGINSFVHIIMYSYYFLSSLGHGVRKYLWWKKYLTLVQMFVVSLSLLCKTTIIDGCECGRLVWYIWMVNGSMFFVLFFNFYIQAYMKNKSKLM